MSCGISKSQFPCRASLSAFWTWTYVDEISLWASKTLCFVSSSLETFVILYYPLLSQSTRQNVRALLNGKLVMSYFVTYNLKQVYIFLSTLFLNFYFKNHGALNILPFSIDLKIVVWHKSTNFKYSNMFSCK